MPPFLRSVAVPWGGAAVVLARRGGRVRARRPREAALPATVAVLALIAAAGLLAPWSPVGAAVVVGLTFPVGSIFGLDGPNGAQLFALLLSTGWAGSQCSLRRSWWAPAADQVLATAGILLWAAPSQAWENLFFCLLLWGSWAVGLLDPAVAATRGAVAGWPRGWTPSASGPGRPPSPEERARIARDVHDSVAHSVSVMVLQLGALRTTVEPGSRVAEVLQGVERLGRQSVDELRGLVGVLRETPKGPPAGGPRRWRGCPS